MTNDSIEKLHILLEDIRNHLTVLTGLIQINSENEYKTTDIELLFNSFCRINKLITEGMSILEQIGATKK